MPYTGDFRYASVGTHRFWCVAERVALGSAVLARLRDETRFREYGPRRIVGLDAEERECRRRYGADRLYGQTQLLTVRRSGRRRPSRSSRLLGPEWRDEGVRGLRQPDVVRVYSRLRVEHLDAPSPGRTASIVDDVALPAQIVGGVRLVPDETSTIRFQGPKGLITMTSPSAKPENFADETAFTVRLGTSVTSDRSPRVELHPPPRGKGSAGVCCTGRARLARDCSNG